MSPTVSGSAGLRVVTWNIRHGISVASATESLRTHPQLRDADVLLLQEMDQDAVAEIAAALDRDFRYASASIHRASGRPFGNAVIAPRLIGDAETVDLPHTARLGGEPRQALRTRVDATCDNAALDVVSVHTETVALSRRRRVAQFARTAAMAEVGPMIVGGDFNTARPGDVGHLRAVMSARGLKHMSANAPPTLRRFGLQFRLDHVFSRGFQVVACGVAAETTASDHLPLWVVLRSDPPPESELSTMGVSRG